MVPPLFETRGVSPQPPLDICRPPHPDTILYQVDIYNITAGGLVLRTATFWEPVFERIPLRARSHREPEFYVGHLWVIEQLRWSEDDGRWQPTW